MLLLLMLSAALSACGGGATKTEAGHEEEAESRTEFTDRIENFFEYDPLKAGEPSQFLIHLTDLSDGTPVEKADVTLNVRSKGGAEVGQVKAKVGKVTGIYLAEVTIPSAGDCARPGATASWAASRRACGYDPSDAAVGGHAPIRCRNATILPR